MLTTVTPRTTDDVNTTAEIKEWLRVDSGDSSQDVVIGLLKKAAIDKIEKYTRRTLITTSYAYTWKASDMLGARLWLPRPTVQSITSLVKYDREAAVSNVTINAANYELVDGLYIVRKGDGFDLDQEDKAAVVTYVAGFGSSSASVPNDIRMVHLELIAYMFENRGEVPSGRQRLFSGQIDEELEILKKLDGYRAWSV